MHGLANFKFHENFNIIQVCGLPKSRVASRHSVSGRLNYATDIGSKYELKNLHLGGEILELH